MAQNSLQVLSRVRTHQIESKQLQSPIDIQVSLPASYENGTDNYAVLYILDGQWFFPHGLSAQVAFTERNGSDTTPEFIVVGITLENSTRYEWSMEAEGLFNFFESELIPFVDAHYSSSMGRILFGWEATAGFVVRALFKRPTLFEGYLAAGPTPIYGEYFPYLKQEFKGFSQQVESLLLKNKFLYMTEAENDYPAHFGLNNLRKMLTENPSSLLRWEYLKLMATTHRMTGYSTIFEGIKSYFECYGTLRHHSIAHFEQLGGFEYINTYYQNRVRKYGFEDSENLKTANGTKRNLLLLAIRENNIVAFEQFYHYLNQTKFLEQLALPHAYRCGIFLLQNKRHQKALEIFEAKYPERAMPFNGLGIYHQQLKNKDQAILYFRKAVEIATRNDNFRLTEYQENLNQILTPND